MTGRGLPYVITKSHDWGMGVTLNAWCTPLAIPGNARLWQSDISTFYYFSFFTFLFVSPTFPPSPQYPSADY